MRKLVAVAAFAVAAVVAVASPALADAGGAPNSCVGRTTSYTAQGNDISPFVSARGIGNVGRANGDVVPLGGNVLSYIKGVVCAPV
jgi:hypothetical protein